jgi:two-component system sensor histidine kinase HydH
MKSRLAMLGFAVGAIGGALDTLLFLRLGVDFTISGRDMTIPVAIYLGSSFAVLGYAIGYFADARRRERRDARIIKDQMAALEESRRVAAQNEKLAAIGRLAAGIAHEVRNPLGVIRASASMVQESFDTDEEPHRACQFICEEIDRLNGLITSLLAFARPSEPRFQSVSIDHVIERAVQLAASQLQQRGIELDRASVETVPEIAGDPDLLAQVLLGLITNAAEAQERGGRISVRVESAPDEVRVEVADAGPGIPDADLERVFEPFFTTKASGTGLGLPMTARIVESHGGQIEARRSAGAGEHGKGACFRIALPLNCRASAPRAGPAA